MGFVYSFKLLIHIKFKSTSKTTNPLEAMASQKELKTNLKETQVSVAGHTQLDLQWSHLCILTRLL